MGRQRLSRVLMWSGDGGASMAMTGQHVPHVLYGDIGGQVNATNCAKAQMSREWFE